MKKTVATTLIIFLFLPVLTGCWSRREVSDLAITVALGIDKTEDEEYIVSAQIINPSETAASDKGGGGGYDTPATTYTARGKILFEALRKLTKEAPRKVYLAHLRIIVISEKVAEEGIYDALDFLSRDHEMRTDFYIVVAKDHTAEETIKVLTSIEKIPANKLFNSLEDSAEEWAATGKIRLNELMDDIVSEGTQPVLTGVTIKGDPKAGLTKSNVETISPKAMLSYSGLAAFRKNKIAGWLNEKESKGYNYIKDNVSSTVIVLDVEDGQAGIELVECKSEVIPRFKNGRPEFEVKVTGDANVADVNMKIDLMDSSVLKDLEEKTNSQMEEVIMSAIEKAQRDYKTDILGFGERIHKSEPKEWKRLKHDWAEIFPDVPVTAHVNIQIRRIGTISNPFHNELKEE